MKVVSNDYKNRIKEMGREIDSVITYYNHYKMITEDNKYILTEDGVKINTEQINANDVIEITAEDIYGVKLITHGSLLKTMMKELDFEIKQDMNIGSIVNYKFGLKVNGDYEYVDYGNFIVNEKEFNEDTQTYSYKAYDMMLKSMIPYKDTSEYPTTLYGLLNSVLEHCGISLGITEFPNSERDIYDNPFNGMDITCRDVLDFITEVTGCSSYIDNDEFIIMWPSETNEILYEDSFKDTNVKFNKVYGPINSILFSRSEDTDIVEIKDDTSIEENGVTQIKIKDNPLLEGNDRSDYFEEMFDVLNGLTYSINELSSIGITYLDYLDKFKIVIGENEYNCLLLNDEINVEQGLEENIFTDEIEETEQEYRTSRLSDKDQKWANIQVKKDLGEISLEVGEKVDKGEVISSINLSTESATIQANKVNLNGYVTVTDLSTSGSTTINGSNITTGTISADRVSGGTLTGTTISGNTITGGSITGTTISNGNAFSVDSNGKVSASDVDITGGSIVLTRNATGQGIPFTIEQTVSGNTYKARMGAGALTLQTNGTTRASFSAGTTEGRFYLAGTDGTIRVQANGGTGNITCVSLTQTSKEEEKKNFKKLENVLNIVKDVDIYEYNMKDEKDTDKKHIGFVIGDKYNYRKEITSSKNDGADLYSMVSVLWQAVKEQQQEIEKLKERIGK